jgi:heptosyltransferase II
MIKIGILQTAFLGDTILLAPMIESIKKKYAEDAEIYLILKKGLEPVFASDPRVAFIVSFDKRNTEKGLIGLLKMSKKIKELGLDVFINTHRSIRSGLLTRLCGVAKTIGFEEARLSFSFKTSVPRLGEHEVLKNHRLLCALDPVFADDYPKIEDSYKLYIDKKSEAGVKDLLKEAGVENNFITIAPGSKWITKRWTSQGFSDLIQMLVSYKPCQIVLTGDEEDKVFVDEIIKLTGKIPQHSKIVQFCGNLDLQSLFALIKRSDVLITNDSAPQHIAAGVGTPVVSIFGPTTKELGYYPFTNKARTIEATTDCRPCGSHGHRSCPKNIHECMNSIRAEEVFKAIMEVI